MLRRSHTPMGALVAALLALAPVAAGAASPPAAPAADTVLSLSATAAVSVPPDVLTANLRASAEAPGAERAQAEVNRAIATALAAARAVPGVQATTAGYATWQRPPGSPGGGAWQASQGLVLTSHDGPALLGLLGRLQAQGLAVDQLGWGLSAAARQAARDRATDAALGRLRGRAMAAARVLGLRFGSFRMVRLGAAPEIGPRPMFATAMRAGAPPPSAVATDVAVSATVSADVLLLPDGGAR
ncbi:MAG: SIMPL domain-containing protein [Proteobacteria bacterium]|nr:SIMPL domain-containing protein [Pseudomonadota bacterium]